MLGLIRKYQQNRIPDPIPKDWYPEPPPLMCTIKNGRKHYSIDPGIPIPAVIGTREENGEFIPDRVILIGGERR